MKQKYADVIILFVALLVGVALGVSLGSYASSHPSVPEWAITYGAKIKVLTATTEGVQYDLGTFVPSNPLVKVWAVYGPGVVLSEAWRVETYGQVLLGMEDAPSGTGAGDYADIFLKMIYKKSGELDFQIVCMGGYDKKITYNGFLRLDTKAGQWMASWSVNA